MALVASLDGLPVGTVSLVEGDHPLDPTPICCLAGLYVLPAWRRLGIGRQLCRAALRQALRLRAGPVGLFTRDAEGFYRRLGWHCELVTALPAPGAPVLGSFMIYSE